MYYRIQGIILGIAMSYVFPQIYQYFLKIQYFNKNKSQQLISTPTLQSTLNLQSKIHPPITIINYPHFTIIYSNFLKIPLAVYQTLTNENYVGTASRYYSYFHQEKSLPKKFRATLDDYKGQYKVFGLHRGHMARAGAYKNNQQSQNETFTLANIIPQNADNNVDLWNSFQQYTKKLTLKCDKVQVISGPLFLNQQKQQIGKDGNKISVKFTKYYNIGQSNIAVPTHLYKILKCVKGKQFFTSAFLMQNKQLKANQKKLIDFQVSLDTIESLSGLIFENFQGKKLQQFDQTLKMNKEQLDVMILNQDLKQQKSLNKLFSIQNQAKQKKILLSKINGLDQILNTKFYENMWLSQKKNHNQNMKQYQKQIYNIFKYSKLLNKQNRILFEFYLRMSYFNCNDQDLKNSFYQKSKKRRTKLRRQTRAFIQNNYKKQRQSQK